MNDHRIVELFENPGLTEPVLIMCLEGWVDASNAAALAARTLVERADDEPVATFDADELLDHRARRPIMRLEDGVIADMSWPSTDIFAATDDTGSDVLLLVGAEPDQRWGAFTDAVVDLCLELDVRMVVGLGAYPATVPHTRPSRVAITAASAESAAVLGGFVRASVEVPTGIQTAIEVAGHRAGVPTLGLWAQVPHYLAGFAYPTASLALIESVRRVTGLHFDLAELQNQASQTLQRVDELVGGQPELRELVEQFESMYDSETSSATFTPTELPTGDDIAAELLQFLRDQDD